jgi:SAM-dependent methyltransferase
LPVTTSSAAELEVVPCAVCGGNSVAPAVSTPSDEYLVALGKVSRKSSWVICKSCGLVFQNPRITAEDEQRLYAGTTYYETSPAVSEGYLRRRLEKPGRVLDWLERCTGFAAPGRTRRMLEVGCGMGGALRVFGDRGWAARGIEPDPDMGRAGRERFGVEIQTGFFGEGVFPEATVDLVYTNHAYEHFRDPLAITRAVAHTLLPGGWLFIAVPTFRRSRGVFSWQWLNAGHTYMFTHVSLGNLVRRAGFEPRAWRYASADGEMWFLAQQTGQVHDALSEIDDWRRVRRELVIGPLLHLLHSPRGWPTVARCYAEEFLGPGRGDALLAGLRRLRWWR